MIIKAIALLVGLGTIQHVMAKQETVNLKIIETSDVHGCFFPYDYIENTPMEGSLARVSTYLKKVRKQYGDNVILLENGDILQGQPTCYYTNFVKPDLPNAAAEIVNWLGYDAQAIGNHDVETGHAVYDKWISELNCPVLGANIIDNSTGKPYVKPYTIIERNGVKVAVIGMITPAIPNWLHEKLWSGLHFEDMAKSAAKWVDIVRKEEKADVVIGLFHSGWHGGISTLHYNEDESEYIARNIPGFDIIFFGHDHNPRCVTVKNTENQSVLCLDPSCNAIFVADADIQLTLTDGKVTDKKISGKLTDVSRMAIDNEFVSSFSHVADSVKSFINKRIGYITESIHTSDSFFGSSTFSDLIHRLQLDITHADISFNAPLTFDAIVHKGDIHMNDMFKLYRYENDIYVMKLTGKEVRKHLEMSYDQWVNTMKSPDDHIMLLDMNAVHDNQRNMFKNLTFNFDSAAGIDYVVDVSKPDGEKVKILRMSNGEAFDENKWYKVVLNSYRGNGGGELLTRGAGIPKDSLDSRIIYRSDRDQRYYLTKEIERQGTIIPRKLNNWRFVPEEWAEPAIRRDRKLLFE
ncbi:MAG: bifunctional metallophosphatase/5'-nucleotidase [Prevotella sp.]